MKSRIVILSIFMVLYLSCKTAQIETNAELKSTPLSVKGKNGFMIGQVIRFGDYSTDKVSRGWIRSYDFPFFIRFQGAKEKLSFQQFGSGGSSAAVSCISKLSSNDLNLANGYFELPFAFKNHFVGNIILAKNNV